MKIKVKSHIYFWIICVLMSCDSPASDNYRKIIRSHPTIISKTLPDYFLSLFQPNFKNKIRLVSSLEHIGRDTVCNFLYDKEYYITLYTISRSCEFSLQNSLRESFGENKEEVGIPFYVNQINLIGIEHRIYVTHSDKPSNIFISFEGSGFSENKKNDVVADYFLNCKSLSIKYKVDGHQEIFGEANDLAQDNTPLEIMFLKNEKKLFLIFITPKKNFSSSDHKLGLSMFKLE